MSKLKYSLAMLALSCAGAGHAQEHRHHGDSSHAPANFEASAAKPFGLLMDDAMRIMDAGMQRAPMNGEAEHDFLAMMVPHHQGAVDMAKAVLLYTSDPAMRNLALGIITEQQNEITLMQSLLARKGQP